MEHDPEFTEELERVRRYLKDHGFPAPSELQRSQRARA
jgi:hypothetical protein